MTFTWTLLKRLFLGALLFVCACRSHEKILGPDEIAGNYTLVSVMGKPLPAITSPGRGQLDSARLMLGTAGELRYFQSGLRCALGTCVSFFDSLSGTWASMPKNRLRFVYRDGSGATEPPIEVRQGLIITTYSVDDEVKEFGRFRKE